MGMTWRTWRMTCLCWSCLFLGVGTVYAARPEEPATAAVRQAAHAPIVTRPLLLSPTQGRPVFVEPGKSFRVAVQFPAPPRAVHFELASSAFPPHRHRLPARLMSADAAGCGGEYDVLVPPDTPEQTYDLEIRHGDGTLRGRHAVAVARLGKRVRLVHLSNMNVGDVGVPEFDRRLVPEINLLGPTMIVATGDFLDAVHDDLDVGWHEVSEFLASFDAPVLAACGDHDDVEHFSRFLAPSPVGQVEVGAYRGLVLYDVPRRPIHEDPEQIRWVEQTMGQGGYRLNFVVSHDECPNLLRYWQSRMMLEQMVRAGRLGVWFSGGHRDWNGEEYGSVLDDAGSLLYVRTHQSSVATRDGAQGVSHYRVLDLADEHVLLLPPVPRGVQPPSIPVGRLRAVFEGPNDGTRPRVALTVASTLPFRMDHLTVKLLLQRQGRERPWCHGAHLERLVELADMWLCWVTFDLPDNGSRRILAGTGRAPAEPPIDVHFVVPKNLVLRRERSEQGVRYCSAENWFGVIQLQNRGAEMVEVMPIVRLDGEAVPYRVVDEAGPMASAYRLRMGPTQVISLQLDMSAVRVAPGRRELQVYLKGGAAQVPICMPLEVTVFE
jgi:hypothetical protein